MAPSSLTRYWSVFLVIVLQFGFAHAWWPFSTDAVTSTAVITSALAEPAKGRIDAEQEVALLKHATETDAAAHAQINAELLEYRNVIRYSIRVSGKSTANLPRDDQLSANQVTPRHKHKRTKRQTAVSTPTYSDDDVTRLLDYHNQLRRQEAASNMLRLVS